MRNSILFVLVVASLESGCGAKLPSMKPFKMDIQQGNVVTSKMLMQLRPGMTRSQVRYIMGTPLIVDSFRDNRWDYFYEMRQQGQIVEKRRVILDFDKDSLVAVRGDVIPSAENPEIKTIVQAPAKKTVDQAADEKHESWTDKLKFWQRGDAAKPAMPADASEKMEPVAAANRQPEAVQANPAEVNTPGVATSADAVNENTVAAQIADTVEPTPVFEQDAVAVTAASMASAANALPESSTAMSVTPVLPAGVAAATTVTNAAAESPALAADAEISQAVANWAQAWRSKNIKTYLAAYAPEFVPEGLPSLSAWEAQRKKRLSPQQGKITLELGELSVAREGDTAVVIFSQKYASKAYRDEMVKRLQLKLDSGSKRWLIVRETVASGADLPAEKQQVTAPEGGAEHLDGVLEQIGF